MEPRSPSASEESVPAGSMTEAYSFSLLHPWLWHPHVIVPGDALLDEAALQAFDGGDGVPLLVHQLLTEGRAVTLTDRYAPVDQMQVPVFREKVPR